MNRRRPGNGRHAHPEREQRWLLASVPEEATPWAEINDRYLTGTTLRVRRVAGPDGVVHKLTQKVRPVADDPGLVMLTTMYLPSDEVAALAALPGTDLRKSRWRVEFAGRQVAVDEFHGRLAGLVLAETELSVREGRLPMPAFARRDVTDDDRFTGGSLANATDAEIAALRAEVERVLAAAPSTAAGAGSSTSR